ncbi:MAG: amidohydrolase [Psychromonas sp.]
MFLATVKVVNKRFVVMVALSMSLLACSPQKSEQSNAENLSSENSTLYFGGDIITMHGDQANYVEAVIETDGKVVYTGNKENALQLLNKGFQQVDLQGKTMLPGFLDPHGHFMAAILMVNQVNVAAPPVGTAQSIADIIKNLQIYQKERQIPEGGWIVGWGYDQDLISEKRHITKRDLDKAFPKRKVMLIHVSMHGAVLNSQALAWANIDEKTATPEGGVIARFANNEPAGLVMESAYLPIFSKLPQPSDDEKIKLMGKAQEMYTSQGYVQAIEGFTHVADLRFLQRAAKAGKNIIDIIALPGFTEVDEWFDKPEFPFGRYHGKFKIHGCKITLDGSPQGKTAFISTPYLTGGPDGEKNWRGESLLTQVELDMLTAKMYKNNIPLQIHANGDAAIDMVIKTVQNAGIKASDDKRTVIIHSQFQRPDHLPHYAKLGLSPSYFTQHAFFWGDVHVQNIGQQAANFISPMKAAKEAGLIISNHSDFYVTPLDPFFIIWTAMARESRSGNLIGAEQRVDAYTALQALTTGPAFQFFEETRKGKIKVGMLADFVIIENNPLKQNVADIRDNAVVMTIKEGQVVYRQ